MGTRIFSEWRIQQAADVMFALLRAEAWSAIDDELDSVPVEPVDPGPCAGWYIGFFGRSPVRQRAAFERLLDRAQAVAPYNVRDALLGEKPHAG